MFSRPEKQSQSPGIVSLTVAENYKAHILVFVETFVGHCGPGTWGLGPGGWGLGPGAYGPAVWGRWGEVRSAVQTMAETSLARATGGGN